MSKREAEFLQKLRATFLLEAREHLQVAATGLLALEKTRSNVDRAEQIEVVFRHTHSLKGAARAASFTQIEAVCQGLEEVFALCKRRGRLLSASDYDALHRAFDLVGTFVDAGGAAPPDASGKEVAGIVRQLRAIVAGDSPPDAMRDPEVEPASGAADVHAGAGSGQLLDEGHAPPPVVVAPTETVRVATPQLDRVLLAAEELLMLKQASTQRADELRGLERGFDEWGKQWLAVQGPLRRLRAASATTSGAATIGDPARVLDFVDWTFGYIKAMEGRLRGVTKAALHDGYATGKQVDELLAEAKNLLMLPFSTLSDVMPKLVRDLARDQGKNVELRLGGGDIHLDKRVLEPLKDVLLHLVRNAIDHGVEPLGQRAAAGKPAMAILTIGAVLLHGNKIEIEVADDGAGIDPERLRKSAIDAGVITTDAARQLDDDEAVELAFRSDVSTSPIITEISGRGLGLAIVRDQVEKVGGRVVIENRAPVGARFRITLPQSLAALRGVFVRAAGQVFVIPTTHVERVARLPRSDLRTVENRETLSLHDRAVSLTRLADVLELQGGRVEPGGDFITVVLVGSGKERMALAVDEVLYDEEVLVKRLERPLVRVRNIAGATVLASGQVLPVLNVADLLKSARRVGAMSRAGPDRASGADRKPIARKILLAEDSITSRLLLKSILEEEGCEVKTAVDGIEAFTALRSEPFDLLVSDIEMPRLDGFDLTARIRADPTLGELPVVLVTALARREDRERGIDVGANAYITKGGFDQRDLIAAVRRLIGARERT